MQQIYFCRGRGFIIFSSTGEFTVALINAHMFAVAQIWIYTLKQLVLQLLNLLIWNFMSLPMEKSPRNEI